MSNKWIFSVGVIILFIVGLWSNSIEFIVLEKDSLISYPSQNLTDFTGTVYISPYYGDDFFVDLLVSATESIRIQSYDFTHTDIRSLITDKLEEGVDVQIMLEDRKYRQFRDAYSEIESLWSGYSNFSLQSDRKLWTNFLHSKYVIVDDHVASIQSANITFSAFRNREHFFVTYDTGIISWLTYLFAKDWSGESIQEQEIHPNILLCPIDCRDDILSLIIWAEESIWIQTQYISDPTIIQTLQSRIDDLDIKIVVADTDENKDFVNYFGFAIVRSLTNPYVHTKTMLIDDRILMLGSINFSTNSLDNNREAGILINDIDAINTYKHYFLQDWENGL